MKLSKKNIDVKTNNIPKHRLVFTVHPHGLGPDSTGYVSLEVTVISKYACPSTPTLKLLIAIRDTRERELGRHSLEQQLQSFFVPKFLSHDQLHQMAPKAKVVMEIHAEIVATTFHPDEYVVVETDQSLSAP